MDTLNRSDSNLHAFLLYINLFFFIFLQSTSRGVGNHKELNFVDAAILEITQESLLVDQTHPFNVFLLNIHRFKMRKRSKKLDNIVSEQAESLFKLYIEAISALQQI